MTPQELKPISETMFGADGIMERNDIQRMLREQISVLDDRLMVIGEEFGDWLDSSRRIDLLCIDSEGNLVVEELKRTDDGGRMELQALRYAAMSREIDARAGRASRSADHSPPVGFYRLRTGPATH